MVEFVRKNARFFVAASVVALALRLLFVLQFPAIVDDSRLYADIATNWLQHGVYGITDSGHIMPTLSRLPGYPAFLAAIFAIFGINNFRAILLIQVLFDLGTCFLMADISHRLFSERAAKAAFFFAAVCPFLADYAAAALTETLEIFFTTLALNLAVSGFARFRAEGEAIPSSTRSALVAFFGCGLSVGACILLRPDGGILLAAIATYWSLLFLRCLGEHTPGQSGARSLLPMILAGIVFAMSALTPLVPWTLRNLHAFHRFEPLAPRYANDSDELVMVGFNRWTKTWIADSASVQEIYWNVPGDAIDVARLPSRAFDSVKQRQETAQIFEDYNRDHDVTPELDARFAKLATERIQAEPLRYYVWLPALRIADMWLRPRTELLPSDPRWWEFNDERRWLTVSLVFGFVNLIYVALSTAGFWRSRECFGVGLFFIFVPLRSLFLGTLENPEPRYTLECYPAVIIFASALLIDKSNHKHRGARINRLPNPIRRMWKGVFKRFKSCCKLPMY